MSNGSSANLARCTGIQLHALKVRPRGLVRVTSADRRNVVAQLVQSAHLKHVRCAFISTMLASECSIRVLFGISLQRW